MHNYQVIRNVKQINLSIPGEILCRRDLTINQKLILGLDYALHKKLGYNSYSSKEVGKMLKINTTYVSLCRKQLEEKGLLKKNGRSFCLTRKALDFEKKSRFQYAVLKDLLNHLSRGFREYFAKRKTTASKLAISVEAISKWNRELHEAGLFAEYTHNSGYCTKQAVIITCSFIAGKPCRDFNHEKDYQGQWVRSVPLLGEGA
ncbi:hypothetical protein [uncultured Salegentibacter sp.]|uniref:hypothetical protein n=1 Tax=uncultured Salegentibacter sp. TaxID=259320 RepID=UPI0030DDDD0B